MLKQKFIKILLVNFILIFSLITFSACILDFNKQREDQTFLLTLSNCSQYISLQQEITSSSSNPYNKPNEASSFTNASQTTKISVLVLKNNVEFEDVRIFVSAKPMQNSFGSHRSGMFQQVF